MTESDFLCEEKKMFRRGIPKKYVVKTKIELEHLTCTLFVRKVQSVNK